MSLKFSRKKSRIVLAILLLVMLAYNYSENCYFELTLNWENYFILSSYKLLLNTFNFLIILKVNI